MDGIGINLVETRHDFAFEKCEDVMQSLDAGTAPLIVTSPPYGIGKQYGKNYSDTMSLDDYLGFSRGWLAHATRVLSEDGSLWLNVGHHPEAGGFVPIPYLLYPILKELGLNLVQEITWEKSSGQQHKRRFSVLSERWLWLAKKPASVLFDLDAVRVKPLTSDKRNNPLGKNPSDVWRFDRVKTARYGHPCPFPVEMIERIIRSCSKPLDRVLDPFGGIGSTAIAAARCNRHSLSAEVHDDFVTSAALRLIQEGASHRELDILRIH